MCEVLFFHALWCGPCNAMLGETVRPLIEAGYNIRTIDVMKHPSEAQRWKVKKLPTTVMLKPGHGERREGYLTRDLFEELLTE